MVLVGSMDVIGDSGCIPWEADWWVACGELMNDELLAVEVPWLVQTAREGDGRCLASLESLPATRRWKVCRRQGPRREGRRTLPLPRCVSNWLQKQQRNTATQTICIHILVTFGFKKRWSEFVLYRVCALNILVNLKWA